jgi:hypothetical protein
VTGAARAPRAFFAACALTLFALCALVAGTARPAGAEPPSPAAGEFGKSLTMDVVLPPELLGRYAAFKPSKPDANESTLVNSMLADSVDWTGAPILVTAKDSPFTVVVTITGTARADGDVATMWQAGWKLEDGSTRSTAFPGLSRNGVKAGERVVMTKAATPTSFKSDRTVMPVLSFVRASNVDIDGVRVQVWSGMGRTSPLQWLMAYRWLLIGVVMLAFALIWLRR